MDSLERSRYTLLEYADEKERRESLFAFMDELYREHTHRASYCAMVRHLLEPTNPSRTHLTMTSFILQDGAKTVGHIAAMIDDRLPAGIGLIGFYECSAEEEAAAQLFRAAEEWLVRHGCTTVRGPIDLTIWHSYRVALHQSKDTLYLEPLSREYYAQQFERNGYALAQQYVSAQRSDFATILPTTKAAYEAVLAKGFTIRTATKESFTEDMKAFFVIVRETFGDSWSYVPLAPDEFTYLYANKKEAVDLDFVEMVFDANQTPVGFCYSVHDPAHKDTMVLKTIAVRPEYQKHGIGAALLHSQHSKAAARGVTRFVYALIRVGNSVTKLPYPGASVIREYVTYEKNLSAR